MYAHYVMCKLYKMYIKLCLIIFQKILNNGKLCNADTFKRNEQTYNWMKNNYTISETGSEASEDEANTVFLFHWNFVNICRLHTV